MIGAHTARALVDLGHEVVVTGHRRTEVPSFLAGRVTVGLLDVTDRAAVLAVAGRHDISDIVHLAGRVPDEDPVCFLRTETTGLLNALDAARSWGVRKSPCSSTRNHRSSRFPPTSAPCSAVMAAETLRHDTYNVSSGRPATNREFADALQAITLGLRPDSPTTPASRRPSTSPRPSPTTSRGAPTTPGSPHTVPPWVDTRGDQIVFQYTGAPYPRREERIVAVVEPERQTVGIS